MLISVKLSLGYVAKHAKLNAATELFLKFLENVQLLLDAKARDAGVYIIGACGWDSIPSEMGTIFTKQQVSGKFLKWIMCFQTDVF